MIDQPTIVCNNTGFRPVERAVAHEMGRAGSAVQPANRNKKDMFGEDAPIWSFLAQLKEREFQEATAKSFNAQQGRYYLETYPAFGNLGLFGYEKCPKYNPAGMAASPSDWEKFLSDWKKLCRHTGQVGEELKIEGLKRWAERMCRNADKEKTRQQWKKDQDFLDAVLCMLFGYIWWLSGIKHSVVIGDNKTGYMVVPCLREGLRATLKNDSNGHNVPVDELFPKEPTSAGDDDGANDVSGKRIVDTKKIEVSQGLHIDCEYSDVIGDTKTGHIVTSRIPDSRAILNKDGVEPEGKEGEKKDGFIAWLIRILQRFQGNK
jgi:predicted RNase H-like nuclease